MILGTPILYSLKRSVDHTDEYGQLTKENFQEVARLPILILKNKDELIKDDPRYSNVTHVGVYEGPYKDVKKHDRIDNSYIVEEAYSFRSKLILYLREVI